MRFLFFLAAIFLMISCENPKQATSKAGEDNSKDAANCVISIECEDYIELDDTLHVKVNHQGCIAENEVLKYWFADTAFENAEKTSVVLNASGVTSFKVPANEIVVGVGEYPIYVQLEEAGDPKVMSRKIRVMLPTPDDQPDFKIGIQGVEGDTLKKNSTYIVYMGAIGDPKKHQFSCSSGSIKPTLDEEGRKAYELKVGEVDKVVLTIDGEINGEYVKIGSKTYTVVD